MKTYLWVADPRNQYGARAVRAISTAMCEWLRPCTLGDFSLLVQREVTKRKHARVASPREIRAVPCASRFGRALA